MSVLIESMAALAEPDMTAKQRLPIYSIVYCLAGAVKDPRAIESFTEDDTGRVHTIIEYRESAADLVAWRWLCQSARE